MTLPLINVQLSGDESIEWLRIKIRIHNWHFGAHLEKLFVEMQHGFLSLPYKPLQNGEGTRKNVTQATPFLMFGCVTNFEQRSKSGTLRIVWNSGSRRFVSKRAISVTQYLSGCF